MKFDERLDQPSCCGSVTICLNCVDYMSYICCGVAFHHRTALMSGMSLTVAGNIEYSGRTIIRPSAAHKAAFLALLCETPNSSRTAMKDCKSENMESGEMTWATVRCAKNCICQEKINPRWSAKVFDSHIISLLSKPAYRERLETPSRNLPESASQGIAHLKMQSRLLGHTISGATPHSRVS
jgi:hypothetical protein